MVYGGAKSCICNEVDIFKVFVAENTGQGYELSLYALSVQKAKVERFQNFIQREYSRLSERQEHSGNCFRAFQMNLTSNLRFFCGISWALVLARAKYLLLSMALKKKEKMTHVFTLEWCQTCRLFKKDVLIVQNFCRKTNAKYFS